MAPVLLGQQGPQAWLGPLALQVPLVWAQLAESRELLHVQIGWGDPGRRVREGRARYRRC